MRLMSASAIKACVLPRCLVALAALPVVLSQRAPISRDTARAEVIIYTPHNEQIRREFADGFAKWHAAKYGQTAEVIWNTPGGTSEIRKMLEANVIAALRNGVPVGGNADLVFGGGSYEYTQFKKELSYGVEPDVRKGRIVEQVPFEQSALDAIYGENKVGDATLYDPDRYWFGTALSGFGIVYNRKCLRTLGLEDPTHWEDLTDARLRGWITLVNPSQSGSVTTAFEAILQRLGWDRGWQIIRRMAANSRSIASSAPKVPLDVVAGDAAAGPSIDFYGRFEEQAVADAGDPDRIGYIDPKGETVIDPDPIALLANAPHRATALHFIEFCLSDEGQALWQFAARHGAPGLGPEEFELRRMPVRRDFIARMLPQFRDKVDPFLLASAVENPDPNARAFIPILFSALCADRRASLHAAWKAITEHPAYPKDHALVTAADVTDPTLHAMLLAFDAMPTAQSPDGAIALDSPKGRAAIRDGWLKSKWKSAKLWDVNSAPAEELRRAWGEFFEGQYTAIVEASAQ